MNYKLHRRRHLTYIISINAMEELMLLYLLDRRSLVWVDYQERLNDVYNLGLQYLFFQVVPLQDVSLQDLLVYLLLRVVNKRTDSHQHFIQNSTESP